MEKIKEYSVKAVKGLLEVKIFTSDERFIGQLSGQIIPFAPEQQPGERTPIMEDVTYGPVEIEADSLDELEALIRKRIEKEVGNILKFGDDK
ncbi:MAG: hypothetical protein PVF75_02530 [Granulosicoccaceae bacterium]|jgi:hypothetical protein